MRPTYAAPALPPPDVLGPDEELIAGRRPVEEAFVARRPSHRLLVVPQRRQALEKIVLHATNLRIPIVELEGGTLTALAGFDGHQGVALVVEPRRYSTVEEILARARERGEPPFVLALDSLEDPQNVGTLLRSAEAAGVHGVLFPTRRQAPLTPSAVKASAGAVEHLLLCPVDDLAAALADLRSHGLRVAGAEADAPLTARQSDLRGPLTIVVGSEGQGLGPAIRRRCDLFMRIPMRGAIGSLNAAVAGSVLLFEAVAQRDPDAMTTPPAEPAAEPATTETDGPADTAGPVVATEPPDGPKRRPSKTVTAKRAIAKAATPTTATSKSSTPRIPTAGAPSASATTAPKAKTPKAKTPKVNATGTPTARPATTAKAPKTAKPATTAKPAATRPKASGRPPAGAATDAPPPAEADPDAAELLPGGPPVTPPPASTDTPVRTKRGGTSRA